jgi:hypothetical protein
MKADPEKATRWQPHIKNLKSSGLSRRDYCEKNGLKLSTLDYWCRKPGLYKSRKRENNNKVPWIPLQIGDSEACGIHLRVGKITIEIKPGFDSALLTDLLRTLGASC